MTHGVYIEIDPAPEYPSARCLEPMRVRNSNPRPVVVSLRLEYSSVGPGSLCQARWTHDFSVRLGASSHAYLGCSVNLFEGSPCAEHRRWSVLAVVVDGADAGIPAEPAAVGTPVLLSSKVEDDLASVNVFFFIGKRPLSPLEVTFDEFVVDGFRLPVWQVGPWPGDQGYWVHLGLFPDQSTLTLQYKFRTGIRTPDDDVVLGYFPDGKFSKAVRVALMKLEPFTDYPGTMEIIVKKP